MYMPYKTDCQRGYILKSDPKNASLHAPFDVAEHLGVAEELSKVDMKHMTRLTDHYVVVVTVADAEDVSGNAVTGAGPSERLNRRRVFVVTK